MGASEKNGGGISLRRDFIRAARAALAEHERRKSPPVEPADVETTPAEPPTGADDERPEEG